MTYIHNWPKSDLEFCHLVPIDTSRFLFRIFLFLFFVCFFSFSSKVASMNAMAILISILNIFFDKSIEIS
jgi:hypothetical protein